MPAHPVEAAQVVLPCRELDPTLAFFTERLGFRIEAIYPADAPSTAIVSGHGVRVQLERGDGSAGPGLLRLLCRDPNVFGDGVRELEAPNGTRIEIVDADPPLIVPPVAHSFVLTRMSDGAWGTGRAGMLYRDLIPDRLGGRFIASHVQIPVGGAVPDYVHYHKIRFQTIYCRKGWVRLVYEDQGPPFVMSAGDCVLQPPRIRHRVLECSPGFEVVELGCPAEHETFADHEMALPTPHAKPERDFEGQRFVRHSAAEAEWIPWRLEGFECRDTGIGEATNDLAAVRVARPRGAPSSEAFYSHSAELVFLFVIEGSTTLACEGEHRLGPGDAVVLPPATGYAFASCSADLELLEIALPAGFETKRGKRGHHP